jgi:hypothetical protein
VTRSKFDLRTSTRFAGLVGAAVSLRAVIVSQWLRLLVGFASGATRGRRLAFAAH